MLSLVESLNQRLGNVILPLASMEAMTKLYGLPAPPPLQKSGSLVDKMQDFCGIHSLPDGFWRRSFTNNGA